MNKLYHNKRLLSHSFRTIRKSTFFGIVLSLLHFYQRRRIERKMYLEDWYDLLSSYGSYLNNDYKIIEENRGNVETYYKYFSIEK